MTHDPHDDRRVVRYSDSGLNGGVLLGMAFAIVIGIGAVLYLIDVPRQTASIDIEPPTTTGQRAR